MAAADSWEGRRDLEVVNETFKANPWCLGAGGGARGGGEPTGVEEGHGTPTWLCQSALTRTLSRPLISLGVGLFPHLQN